MKRAQAKQLVSDHEDNQALPLTEKRVYSGVVRKGQRPADPSEDPRPAAAPAPRTAALFAVLAVVAVGYCSLYLLDEAPSRARTATTHGSKW